jgi:hypothetical protein
MESSIDSQIDAKQTIFTTGATEPNNTLNVNTVRIKGGANKLYVARDKLQSLLDTKQQLITTVLDLTLRIFTCISIVIDCVNFNVTLTELETTLDTTAKKKSANTFTGLQTINGDLKADYVLVKNTTPTLTTHLTSKLCVDNLLNEKQDVLSRSSHVDINSLIVSNDTFSIGSIVPGQISCNSLVIEGVNIDTSLNEKKIHLMQPLH